MPDSKVSALPVLAVPAGVDRILVIDNPLVNAASVQISFDSLFAQVPSNTSIGGTFTAEWNATFSGSNSYFTSNVNVTGTTNLGVMKTSSNGVTIQNSLTPANSSITIEQGKIFWDSSYLYVATANNTVKRVALSSF